MKILKIDEELDNLNRVVNNSLINAVTEMPPAMADAYEDSVEADKHVEDVLKETGSEVKEKPFIGAKDQPLPKEPEEATSVLEESLFEDWDSKNDDCEWREWKKDELIEKGRENWDETDWDAWYYINNAEEEKEFNENLQDDDYFDFVHDLSKAMHKVCLTHWRKNKNIDRRDLEQATAFVLSQIDWDNFDEYMYESLNEDGRQSSKLKQYSDKDIEEEEVDLWTCVYSSLIDHPDEAAWKAVKKKNTVILPKKQRYKVINTDADGNIIVHGKTDADLDPARKVADFYGLEYKVKESPSSLAVKYPEKRFSLTIKVPEEAVYNPNKK